MIITILLAASVASATQPTEPPQNTDQPKTERVVVGGYNSDGKKVSQDEQTREAMQKRIDDLNNKYKNIDKEDTEHKDYDQPYKPEDSEDEE